MKPLSANQLDTLTGTWYLYQEGVGYYGVIGADVKEPDAHVTIGKTVLPIVINNSLRPDVSFIASGDEMAIFYNGKVSRYTREFLTDWLNNEGDSILI